MPIIQVNMLEGRTAAQKRALHVALSDAAVAALGVPRESVRVLIHEFGAEDFSVAGVTAGERPLAQRRGDASRAAGMTLEAVPK